MPSTPPCRAYRDRGRGPTHNAAAPYPGSSRRDHLRCCCGRGQRNQGSLDLAGAVLEEAQPDENCRHQCRQGDEYQKARSQAHRGHFAYPKPPGPVRRRAGRHPAAFAEEGSGSPSLGLRMRSDTRTGIIWRFACVKSRIAVHHLLTRPAGLSASNASPKAWRRRPKPSSSCRPCERGQGYFFSRPVDASRATVLLQQGRAKSAREYVAGGGESRRREAVVRKHRHA